MQLSRERSPVPGHDIIIGFSARHLLVRGSAVRPGPVGTSGPKDREPDLAAAERR